MLRNIFAHYLEVLVPIHPPVPHQHVYPVDNYAGKKPGQSPSARMTKAKEIGDIGPYHTLYNGLNLSFQPNFRANPLEPSKSVKVLKLVSDPRE